MIKDIRDYQSGITHEVQQKFQVGGWQSDNIPEDYQKFHVGVQHAEPSRICMQSAFPWSAAEHLLVLGEAVGPCRLMRVRLLFPFLKSC